MKPEYIGIGNFDTMNYVYAYCKCPLPVDYAIKWPLIKDGKPHSYTCTCEDCGTTVSTIAKSYGPEVYKEIEMEATKKAIEAFISNSATNGDIIKVLFPKIDDNFSNVIDLKLWWNAPYKGGAE